MSRSPDFLAPDAPAHPDYPFRCSDCGAQVHRYARFPEMRCVDCHARVAAATTDARELARMWGADHR